MKSNPDAIIEVRFKTYSEGGRKTPITGSVYNCPLFVKDTGFDCRIALNESPIELGVTYELPVWFLNKELVLPHIWPGVAIYLWEGKEIAKGTVKYIYQ